MGHGGKIEYVHMLISGYVFLVWNPDTNITDPRKSLLETFCNNGFYDLLWPLTKDFDNSITIKMNVDFKIYVYLNKAENIFRSVTAKYHFAAKLIEFSF